MSLPALLHFTGDPEAAARSRSAYSSARSCSSVRMADRIVVLVDGAIEADDMQAALVQQRGRYSELFELQAAGYR